MKCVCCPQKTCKSAWHTCPQLCHDWKLPVQPGAGSTSLCVPGACMGHLGSLVTLLPPLAARVAIPARAKVPRLNLLPEVKVLPACAILFSPWKYPDVPETDPSFLLMPGLIFSDSYGNIMVLLKCNHFFPSLC